MNKTFPRLVNGLRALCPYDPPRQYVSAIILSPSEDGEGYDVVVDLNIFHNSLDAELDIAPALGKKMAIAGLERHPRVSFRVSWAAETWGDVAELEAYLGPVDVVQLEVDDMAQLAAVKRHYAAQPSTPKWLQISALKWLIKPQIITLTNGETWISSPHGVACWLGISRDEARKRYPRRAYRLDQLEKGQ